MGAGIDAKGDYMKLDTSGSGALRAPFAMRAILTVTALALSIGLAACGSTPNTTEGNAPAASEQTSQGDSQESTSDAGTQETVDYTAQRQEEMAICQKFIEAYDQRPGVTPMTMGSAFDPQADGSSISTNDFSEDTFAGSYGTSWTEGDIKGELVSFKSGDGVYGIIVMAVGPQTSINGFYRDAITVLDPSVDQNNLSAAIMDAQLNGGDGAVEGCDLPLMKYSTNGTDSSVVAGSANFSQTDASAAIPQKQDENADQTEGYALVALEDYGKQVYPYGFKLHTFLGMQVDEHPSPDVWEFQVTCDVTNEYGATAKDQICNATVTLVDGVWQVTDFSVH